MPTTIRQLFIFLILSSMGPRVTHAAQILRFTDRATFEMVVNPDYQWDFFEFRQGDLLSNYEGPGGITIPTALGTNNPLGDQMPGLQGGALYFNSLGQTRMFNFSTNTYSVGLNVAWADHLFTSTGWMNTSLTMLVFGADGTLLGNLAASKEQAYLGPIYGTGTPYYGEFLGILSDRPIGGIYFEQRLSDGTIVGGAAFYDNIEWSNKNLTTIFTPKPSTLMMGLAGILLVSGTAGWPGQLVVPVAKRQEA